MNKKILIIEDDPAIVDSMQMLLEMEEYVVETITDAEAIHAAKAINADLILLDIWMSGQDGRDIAKYLKSNKTTNKIPIIMVSASKDIERSAKESGADDFLAKPFEMDELLVIINKYVN